MIFATVGTQHVFPRLVHELCRTAHLHHEKIVAQVGDDKNEYLELEAYGLLKPIEYRSLFAEARLVVAHAGIGTVLTAKRLAKPVVIVPRRFEMGEDVNNHQMATARQLLDVIGIYVAWEVDEVSELILRDDLVPARESFSSTTVELIEHLRLLISGR